MTDEFEFIVPMLTFAGLSLIVIAAKSLIELVRKNDKKYTSLIYGVLFGTIGSLTLAYPIAFAPGYFLDLWLPFTALASAFGGPYSSLIAGAIEIMARYWAGGDGATGGMLAISMTAIAGYAFRNKIASLRKAPFFGFLTFLSTLMFIFIIVAGVPFYGFREGFYFLSSNGTSVYAGIFIGTMILGHALRFIEELLKNQRQLKLNQTHMNVLFDRVRDVVLVVAQDGTIRRASNSCIDSFGRMPKELIGTSLYDIMHPDDANYIKRRALENSPTPTSEGVRMRLKHKDGTWRTIETTRSSFFQEDGEYRYIATARDITHRLENDRALLERETQLKSILDNSPSPILLKNLDGKFILTGKSSEEYIKDARRAMKGQTSEEVYPQGSDILAQSNVTDKQVIDHGKTVKYEVSMPTISGEIRYFVVTKFPIKDKNHQVHAVGIIATDITEIKKTEEHLRRTQKMEALGQFTGGVAHDFNNLLNVVIGGLEMLGDDDMTPEEQEKVLNMALNSATRGAELTQRLLAYSRKQVLTPKSIEASTMVTGLLPILRSLAGETIKLNIKKGPTPSDISVDHSQLENAIINLVVNARDAMNGDGNIDISIDNKTLDTDTTIGDTELAKGPYVVIAVKDNGSGMSKDVMKDAISPFFTTKEVGKGSGLGLSMVHGFINQSGGGMTIESELGEGTTISLYIPVAVDATVEEETQELKPIENIGNLKVLVVEDNPDLRNMALYSFKRMGFETRAASSGTEAIALVEKTPDIDLLFTDVVMPGGMSGLDLARRLKKSIKNLKVIYTSGYPETAITVQQELKSNEEFLHKPYKKHLMKEKIHKLFAKKQPPQDASTEEAPSEVASKKSA